ncbi:MAG: OmpA family protein [Bacteroidales bacterium]|nr:OmpA family protein [Bacteroidales bacterium]
MKIKAFLFAALLLVGASAFAQEATEAGSDKGPTDSFISNSFKDNWFIGGGIGWNHSANGFRSLFQGQWMTVGGGIAADFNFGKWLDPMWGIRAGFNGVLNSPNVGTGDEYPFLFVHGDVMWNVTNQTKGYIADRKYQFIPYLSAGAYLPFKYTDGSGDKNHFDFGVGLGFLNKLALSERLDLDIDLLGIIIKDATLVRNYHNASGISLLGIATVGVSYKLGDQPGWQTKADALMPATVAAAEAAAALAAVQAEKEQLAAEKEEAEAAQEEAAKENEALKEELASNAAQNEAIVKNLMETPAVVYFEIGQATLSVKELEHFDRIVKTMLSQTSDIQFTVTGLTDHNTGSARRNKQLQKQRANYIQKLLTDKYGLNKDQFEIIIDESAQNRFTTIELNRAVIIESAKAAEAEEAPAEEPAE